MMFDHWDLVHDATGAPNAAWQRNFSLIRTIDTQWISVTRILESTQRPQAPVVATRRFAVASGFWTGSVRRRKPGITDSTYALVAFRPDTPRVFPLVSAAALDSLTHGVYDPDQPPALTAINDSTFAILGTECKAFALVELRYNGVFLNAIRPQGLLDTVFRSPGPDSRHRLEVADLFSVNGELYVAITDNRAPKGSRVVLQTYTPEGEFLSEAVVIRRSRHLDECSGATNNTDAAVLLTKWDDIRWRVLPIAP
ncbi:MAG: hypothetical protein JST22_07915 [Bacteroidetes bacterium]|nr:hypothetical protein [Bacteroidota bacterium]